MGGWIVVLDLRFLEGISLQSETLRPEWNPANCQPFSVLIYVHQREACTQPLMVLPDAAISHLVETEDAFEY